MNTSPFVKIFSDKVYKTGKKFTWAIWDQDLDGLLMNFIYWCPCPNELIINVPKNK